MKNLIYAAKRITAISMIAALVFVDFGLSAYPAMAAGPGSTGPGGRGTPTAGTRGVSQTPMLDVPIQGIEITINGWRGTAVNMFNLEQMAAPTSHLP